jgi:hypothetical protein
MHQFVLGLLENLRSRGNQDCDVTPVSAVPLGTLSMPPSLGLEDPLVLKVKQRIYPVGTLQDNVAALAAISSARSSSRNKLLSPESEAAIPSAAGTDPDPGLIDKHVAAQPQPKRVTIHI